MLLESRADVHTAQSGRRLTPLHCAAMCGHEEIAERLLAAGASPAATDKFKRTASEWAARRGHGALAATLESSLRKAKAAAGGGEGCAGGAAVRIVAHERDRRV